MTQAQYTTQDGIAIITLDNPPVNGLGHELARHRRRRSQGARPTPESAPSSSPARERRSPAAPTSANSRRPRRSPSPTSHRDPGGEGASKPVIAAILGLHGRRARAGPGLPLPGRQSRRADRAARGQARPGARRRRHAATAARRSALEMALNMIVSGDPVLSEKLKGTQLFDAIIETRSAGGAVAFARQVVAEKRGHAQGARPCQSSTRTPKRSCASPATRSGAWHGISGARSSASTRSPPP